MTRAFWTNLFTNGHTPAGSLPTPAPTPEAVTVAVALAMTVTGILTLTDTLVAIFQPTQKAPM